MSLQENDEKSLETQKQLGQNAYETDDKNDITVMQENDSYFGKPEKYDYSQVELPENYCYNEELLNEFNDLAGKYNLSQKGANELMSMAVKLTKLTGDNYSKTIANQNRQKINNYKNMLNNDREIGGVNLNKTMHTANMAYTEFADEDVQQLLYETGLNCHPKIVKMYYNIGRRMRNDDIYGINSAAVVKENREDILFPTM